MLKTGKLIKTSSLIAWILPNNSRHHRVGFIFSKKKVPKAVWRNKLRRLGREKFRKVKQHLFVYDVVIGMKTPILNINNLKDINHNYDELFSKIFLVTSGKSN